MNRPQTVIGKMVVMIAKPCCTVASTKKKSSTVFTDIQNEKEMCRIKLQRLFSLKILRDTSWLDEFGKDVG